MSIERTYYCDGPDCERHARSATPPPYLPGGTLELRETVGQSEEKHHFCGYDCLMKWAAQHPAEEIIPRVMLEVFERVLLRIGGWCCHTAYAMERKRTADLPRCPDCGIEPWDGSENFDCPTCTAARGQQRDIDAALYAEAHAAYDEGFRDGQKDMYR